MRLPPPPPLLLLLLLLQLLVLLSSSHFNHSAQGRSLLRVLSISDELGGEKVMGRVLIGSRPPKCERRCKDCEHCEAVQVPVIPQEEEEEKKKRLWYVGIVASNFRSDYNSNYKPLSWKCKCGDALFNP